MYYHASQTANIKILEPRVSNHGKAWVYLSEKRENVLVYLSNAVEKYCTETGFDYNGIFSKWGPYGFDQDGILTFEEYYPNALYETYAGVSGYIYRAEKVESIPTEISIPNAIVSDKPVPVIDCEFIPDAYTEILKAQKEGRLRITKYDEFISKREEWLRKIINEEYAEAVEHPEYRYFLKGKFGVYLEGRNL